MDKWSYSKINTANYCTFQFFLKYIHPKKPRSLRLSAYVKGSLLHDQIDKFWNRLGTPEETAKKSSPKKYSDAEEFAKYTQGKWKRIIVADKHAETKIHWRFEEEPWQILNQLPKICVPLFYELSKEGPPLFSELPFDFMYENKRFIGRIDEVRLRNGKVVVRDFKSGKPWLGEMKLKYDPQLTLYNAGLYSLISSDNIFAGKLGLKSDSFPKYQIPICSDFEMEFFLIESLPILNDNTKKISWKVELTPKTKRVPQHFLSLIDMINGTRQDIETGNVYPESGRKCESCDMSVACSEEIEKAGSGVLEAKAGQKLFSFMSPRYLLTKEQELELKKLREPKNDENQKKMRFRYKKD